MPHDLPSIRAARSDQKLFPNAERNLQRGLCAEEIAIYAYLMFRENRESYQCWPSYKTIGAALKMSKNTVRKYVQQLIDKGFVWAEPTKVQTKSGEIRNGNLLFTIRPMQEPTTKFRDRTWAEVQLELTRTKLARFQEHQRALRKHLKRE